MRMRGIIMNETYSINCSPIKNISGIDAFIINFVRHSKTRRYSMDRLSIQMPGYIVLRNKGFETSEIDEIDAYIKDHLGVLVDMALDSTERLIAAEA